LKSLENVVNENVELKKRLEGLEARRLVAIRNDLVKKSQSMNGSVFVGDIVEVSNPDALKKLCFDLKNELQNYLVVLAADIDGKAYVAVLIDEKLSAEKKLDASKIIKEQIAPLIKGGGGGQKTLATAGGQDASNLKQVIEKVKALL